jgi:hypothetical protein
MFKEKQDFHDYDEFYVCYLKGSLNMSSIDIKARSDYFRTYWDTQIQLSL